MNETLKTIAARYTAYIALLGYLLSELQVCPNTSCDIIRGGV